MIAIVLAAGFATRLYPLTRDQAKPLLDIAGRPMLSRLMDKIVAIDGLTEVVVVVNGKFASDFESWNRHYESSVPVRILNDGATDDETRLGANRDMKLAFDDIDARRQDPGEGFLVAAADNLFEFDLAGFAREFRALKRPLLLLREMERPVPPSRYNEVEIDGEGNVTSFREKPPDPAGTLAALCLYFFSPDARETLGAYLASGGNPDAPGYFVEWLVARRPVAARRIHGLWFDIGNLKMLDEARRAF